MESIEQNETSATIAPDDKKIAVIAYITIIGLIAAFVMNNEKKQAFAQFHIRQCLGLALTGVALWAIGIIPILGWIISILGTLALIVMWFIGLFGALNGRTKPIPILGGHYQKWFANI